jgi:hypothetical protein
MTRVSEQSLTEVRRALQSLSARLDVVESDLGIASTLAQDTSDRLDNWSVGPLQDDEERELLDSDDEPLMSHGNIEQWLDNLVAIIEGPILDSDDLPITDQGDCAIGSSGGDISQASSDTTSGVSLPATFQTSIS